MEVTDDDDLDAEELEKLGVGLSAVLFSLTISSLFPPDFSHSFYKNTIQFYNLKINEIVLDTRLKVKCNYLQQVLVLCFSSPFLCLSVTELETSSAFKNPQN